MNGGPVDEAGTRRPVVVIGSRPYDARVPLGDWQLARAFARLGHDVLYVDPPTHPFSRRARPAGRRLEPDPAEPGVDRFTPVALGGGSPWRMPRLVEWLVGLQLRLLLRDKVDPLVVTVAPERGMPRGLGRHTLLYWQKDRQWASAAYARPQWLQERHLSLLRAADLRTGVSTEIAADGAAVGVEVHVVPNGVDLEHFRTPVPPPADYEGIPRPRVLFSGAWGWRVDAALLQEIAVRCPEWQFVLVGAATEQLPAGENVHWLGARDYSSLPGYLQHADLGMVPYKDEPFNAASAPLKVWEYLAAGLPVVTTPVVRLPEQIPVTTALGAVQWQRALHALLSETRTPIGRPDLEAESWEGRAGLLLELARRR